MKYVLKAGPDQEKHVLNNYLINSGSLARHCHPNDFIAWVVTNCDLGAAVVTAWLPFFFFVMLMESEDLKKKKKKAALKDQLPPH